jgi:ATP-dependent DNA ligase
VVFDVLHHEGESCLDKPLEERKAQTLAHLAELDPTTVWAEILLKID